MEIRKQEHYPGTLEIRAEGDGPRKIAGLGAPYGVWSQDLGGFRERFAEGAFRESVERDDIRAVHNHDSNMILGRRSSGTLTLMDTSRGVEYEVEPPDTGWARDLMVSIERRDVTGNSFGFFIESRDDEEWNETEDGVLERTIRRATMVELGPQPFPAYEQTDVEARSLRSVLEAGMEAVRSRGVRVDVERHRLDLDEQDARLKLRA